MVAFLQMLLGSWGRAVLAFYQANSLWLDLIIIVYGVWVVLSWINLKAIRTTLIRSLMDQIKPQLATPAVKQEKKVKPTYVVPWEQVVGQTRFPFVAFQYGLVPHRLSIARVQSMLPVDDLVKDALFTLKRQRRSPVR